MKSPVILTIILILSCFSASSTAQPEREDHKCLILGIRQPCNYGRCCSIYKYCSSEEDICGTTLCLFQCFPPPSSRQTAVASARNVVNATYNHYYDEFEASSSSCAALLNTKPQAQAHKYGSAGFRQDDDDDDASVCGLCLKLKNLKSGTEATVRIVHERTIEGLELDKDTFNKLKSNDDVLGDDHLVLKYDLTSCED